MLARDDLAKATHRVAQRYVGARRTGKGLGHVERLREEALDATGTGHRDLLFIGELVHTQNGDDVLKVLVLLKDLLHLDCGRVVLLAHDVGRQRTAG